MASALRKDSASTAPTRRRRKNPINDLDLKNWKQYDDIWVDSLWLIDERDRSGNHSGHYHGNFVPQIPRQMIQRYTKAGDAVLDVFAGSGTTLIEAVRAGRHGLGIELLEDVAQEAEGRAKAEPNPAETDLYVARGDNRSPNAANRIRTRLAELGQDRVQLVMAHPPYHDIIQFSEDENCMSNAESTEHFSEMYGEMVDNIDPLLEEGRYFCLVIGDKYAGGEWIPLGFHLMQEMMTRNYKLKSLIVKNMAGNRAKRNVEQLWRYRALSGGFYIFKHEYVMIFQKGKAKRRKTVRKA